MMGNGKKIRFDAEDPHGYDEHFHIQREAPPGSKEKWVDDGDQHMYFFKKD